MAGNHYGCLGQHNEFTCMSKFYHDKRFTRARWCSPCLARFPEGGGDDTEPTAAAA